MRENTGEGPEVPPLNHLYLNLHPGCNLHCSHCWVNEGAGASSMPVSSWKPLMEDARKMGVSLVKFTGGEPLLHPDFVELYSAARSIFPEVIIETNGTVTPPGLFRVFRKTPPDHVAVSLDSHLPSVHDTFRGSPGAWKKTVDFIGSLAERSRIRPQVIMSLGDPDRAALLNMVSFLGKTGASSLKVNLISPVGRGISHCFGREDELSECVSFIEWAFRDLPEWVLPDAPPAFAPVNRLKTLGTCSVLNLLGVLPDGTISFCGIAFSLPELAMGTYPEVSLQDLWIHSPLLKEFRRSLTEEDHGVCSQCIHWKSCVGDCVMKNYAVGGRFSSPHPFCESAFRAGLFPETRLHG